MVRSHYENLQVAHNASNEVIRGAYKYLSQKWHPDRVPPDKRAEAERVMKLVNEAYAVLSDATLRRQHDAWIAEELKKEQAAEAAAHSEQQKSTSTESLSDEIREHYIKSICTGSWPLALLSAVVTVFIMLVILLRFEWIKEKVIAYPLATSTAVILYTLLGTAVIVNDKKKSLRGKDDATLRFLYERSSKRKTVALICLAILIAGAGVGYALLHGKPTTAPQEPITDAPSATPTVPGQATSASSPPGTPRPAVEVEPKKAVTATNECTLPLLVSIAFQQHSVSEWTILTTTLEPSRSQQFEPTPARGTYYHAKSIDGRLDWGASADDPTAQFITINGELEAIGFKRLFNDSEDRNTELVLRCN